MVIKNITQEKIDGRQDIRKVTMNELLTKRIGHTKFKGTKMGRIPEGWNSYNIGGLGKFFSGLTGKTSKDFGSGRPFLTYMQVFKQSLSQKSDLNFVEIEDGESQSQVEYGDILFTISSETPDEVGMTAVFLESDWSPYLNSFCFGLRLHSFEFLHPDFARHFLRGDGFREDIRPLAQGSTRYNLSKENLKKLVITIPTRPEQKKIASILTSVDEVIEKIQAQARKLQDLKKATMNELLTKGIGHTKFKDTKMGRIPEGWQIKKLGSLCSARRGTTYIASELSEDGGQFPLYINMKSFKVDGGYDRGGDKFYMSPYLPKQILGSNDLPIANTDVTDTCNILGVPAFIPEEQCKDILFSHHVTALSLSKNLDKKFAFYLLCSSRSRSYMRSVGRGTTVKMLDTRDVANMDIILPSSPPEQRKIASILTSIDELIEKTQVRVDKFQSLKKSLMQDLLTGKVRVKVN